MMRALTHSSSLKLSKKPKLGYGPSMLLRSASQPIILLARFFRSQRNMLYVQSNSSIGPLSKLCPFGEAFHCMESFKVGFCFARKPNGL
jgi:hypothetical protein